MTRERQARTSRTRFYLGCPSERTADEIESTSKGGSPQRLCHRSWRCSAASSEGRTKDCTHVRNAGLRLEERQDRGRETMRQYRGRCRAAPHQHRGHWRPGAETRLSVPKLCLEAAGMRDLERRK
jgi:hypothetical protein